MRVLIADDSAIIRAMLEQNLSKEPDIEIVSSVSNGRKAVDSAKIVEPDLVICDSEMPEMNGWEASRLLAKLGIPVLLFGDEADGNIKAQSAGASGYIQKPNLSSFTNAFFEPFLEKIREIVKTNSMNSRKATRSSAVHGGRTADNGGFKILCIGASTGGPTAVAEVLSGLGRNFPLPILYTQHIEIGADKKMADWFNSACPNVTVQLVKDGIKVAPGNVYMAPADKHLIIESYRSNGMPIIALSDDPPVRFLRPAVDKMFFSAANLYANSCLGVLLTGMGRDGADGCKAIIDAGGYTIVEDESTCAVFGMPAAAIEVGGASEVLPRDKIAEEIRSLVGAR